MEAPVQNDSKFIINYVR